jgi:sensor histidine kinase YesM
MAITSSPAISPPRRRLKRLINDLRFAVGISAFAAVVITLVEGNPQGLYEQLVYSLCIGIVGFTIVDVARLTFWDDPSSRKRRLIPFLCVLLASAPLAHYTGIVLGSLIMNLEPPRLSTYPSPRQIGMILFTFLGVCVMSLLALSRERMIRIKAERGEATARAERIERQALQAQLRLLQAQIEPHMLFNTLANLQGLIGLDPDRASQMLDQLIQYLRATLSASRAETTTLEQEFAAMHAYLGLMAVRMGERLAYQVTLPDALRAARLPPMLLQPLVENAIIHGLEPKIDGGEVVLAAAEHNGRLEISVSDTGLGLDHPTGTKGGGVGVANARERLHALYGQRAGVLLTSASPHGAVARLTLPLEFE